MTTEPETAPAHVGPVDPWPGETPTTSLDGAYLHAKGIRTRGALLAAAEEVFSTGEVDERLVIQPGWHDTDASRGVALTPVRTGRAHAIVVGATIVDLDVNKVVDPQ